MRHTKRPTRPPCSHPGCTVKRANYRRQGTDAWTCARHLWGADLIDLKRSAARFGATIEDHSDRRTAEYQVAAPTGHVWNCTGDIHWIVLHWHKLDAGDQNRPAWPAEKAEAIADAIERIDMGTTPCDDPDCDVCHPETD
jgi:hypothetical protein